MNRATRHRIRAQQEAERRLALLGGILDRYARCDSPLHGREGRCAHRAGHQTDHLGVGPCKAHGGTSRFENTVAGYMMAHRLSRELDISPWEGMLLALRRAAGRAAFYDSKIAAVEDDDELRPDGSAYDWVLGSERAYLDVAKFSKAALDAGLAERLVQQVELEVGMMARVLDAALEALGLSEEREEVARLAMRRALLALPGAAAQRDEDFDTPGTVVIEHGPE